MTFSSLEKLSIHRTLAELALEVEPAPWGKKIGQIRVYNEDVFAEKNWLRFFNVFHYTTTDASIRNQLTIDAGQPWNDELIAESARNLKDPLFTSVVALVPTKAADPSQVDLLVVTRDIWSLRLNSKLDLIEGSLTGLQISLSENNFLGRRKTLAFSVNLDQASVLTGPLYIDKNFLGKHLDFRAQVARIYTRQSLEVFQPAGAILPGRHHCRPPHMPSGDPGGLQDDGVLRAEGSRVALSLTKTLWSLASTWGIASRTRMRSAVVTTAPASAASTIPIRRSSSSYRASIAIGAGACRPRRDAAVGQCTQTAGRSRLLGVESDAVAAAELSRRSGDARVLHRHGVRTELVSSPFLEYSSISRSTRRCATSIRSTSPRICASARTCSSACGRASAPASTTTSRSPRSKAAGRFRGAAMASCA